jgi:hypothetical protein
MDTKGVVDCSKEKRILEILQKTAGGRQTMLS